MTQPYMGKAFRYFFYYVPYFPSLAVNSRGPVSSRLPPEPGKKLLGPFRPTAATGRLGVKPGRHITTHYGTGLQCMNTPDRRWTDWRKEGRKRDEDGMPPMATTHYTPTSRPFFHPVVHARTAYLHTGTYREGNHRVSHTKRTLTRNTIRKKTIKRKRDFSRFVFGEFSFSSS